MWSGEYAVSVDQLARALALDDSLPATRWFLVEALTANSAPGERAEPDFEGLERARTEWDEAVRRFGEPTPEYAWTYVTRGLIVEWESWQSGVDREAALWERLALIERSLVLDRSLSRTWAASAAALRGLGFVALPLESIQQVIELGGVDAWAESERLAILAERGDFEEAFEAAVTYGERYGDDPYIHWLKAWLAYRLGQPEDALTYLRLPLSHEYDLARYLSLSALCNIKIGDLDAARRDYAATLERGRGVGSAKVLLMLACIAIGDEEGMRHWFGEAEADPSINLADMEEARAQMDLHNGDLDSAITHLQTAIGWIRNERELVDFVDHFETRLHVLPGDEAVVENIRAAVSEGVRDLTATQLEALREAPPTGDSELSLEFEKRAASPITEIAVTAITAVRARRLWHQGAHVESADDYERLLETSFAPEARRALRETLLAAIEARSKVGNVTGVQELQARLEAHHLTSEIETATAIAEALTTAGRVPEAVSVLDSSLQPGDGIVPTVRLTLFDRLGMLALLRDDPGEAERQFRQGQELAKASADPAGEARFAAHLAVSAALSGDYERIHEWLEAALDAWARAGAYQPDNSLRQELRSVLESSELAGKELMRAAELLTAAVRQLEDSGRVSADVSDHLIEEIHAAARS
jgi:tetratricopeptide (TPR) repeat protein